MHERIPMEKKHTISILVENEFGVLARVAGLFSSKGYNIDSLSVSETPDPSLSRMTIMTHGNDQIIEQIIKQLNKLVNTIRVEDMTNEKHMTREMCLVKLKSGSREEIIVLAEKLNARILTSSPEKTIILELTGEESHISKSLEDLKPYGLMEVVRTGSIAIQKGDQILS